MSPYILTYLRGLMRHFSITLLQFNPEQGQELLALVEELKTRLEDALPRLRAQHARRLTREQETRERQLETREQMVDSWLKKTEKKAKVVKNSDFCRECDDECGICLDKHTKDAMVVMGCSHELGRECFLKMVNTDLRYGGGVKCPMCRETVKQFQGYRKRQAPRPRNQVPT